VNGARQPTENIVRRWVRFYTFGLEEGARHDRRAEIDSDLWEHRNHAAAKGEGSAATSLSILARWAAGIPADVSWRASQRRRSGRTTKENILTKTLGRYWWQTLAALTAGATVYAGIRQFFTDEVSAEVSAGKVGALFLFVGAGALTLLGLALFRTQPRRGASMVIVGVLPAALVGLFGIGIIVGLIVSLAGGEGWWWMPVGIASALATASGVGAFGAWWHAASASATTNKRITLLPIAFVLGGLVAAGVGVSLGMFTIPLLVFGAVACLTGISMWSRRTKTTP
jgi:hypothetical protein